MTASREIIFFNQIGPCKGIEILVRYYDWGKKEESTEIENWIAGVYTIDNMYELDVKLYDELMNIAVTHRDQEKAVDALSDEILHICENWNVKK